MRRFHFKAVRVQPSLVRGLRAAADPFQMLALREDRVAGARSAWGLTWSALVLARRGRVTDLHGVAVSPQTDGLGREAVRGAGGTEGGTYGAPGRGWPDGQTLEKHNR